MFGKLKLLFLHFFLALTFLLSGLILNFTQLCLYLLLYNVNRNIYRRLNYYLIYSCWSQLVAVAEWFSGCGCRIYADEETLKQFGKEHSIIIMNHKYDIDWLMCWIVVDKLRVLANSKTIAKRSLSKIPIIGWGWIFAEMIFLDRNWEKDCLVLGKQLDELIAYQDPIMLLMFCEGTRFTQEKHQTSVEFAKQKNLAQLKHHLQPRTRGFNFTVRHLKGKLPAVYDIQLAFKRNSVTPTFSNILKGKSIIGDMHIRRIPASEIPTDSEEESSKWLYDLYQKKDKMFDDYLKTEKFPDHCIQPPPRWTPALNFLLWSITIGTPVFYSLWKMLTSGSTLTVMIATTCIILVMTVLYFMVQSTKATKGSSYGKNSPAVPSSPAKNGVLHASHNDLNSLHENSVVNRHENSEAVRKLNQESETNSHTSNYKNSL